jgi:hypothetical protein
VSLRVPYPRVFFTKNVDGRIDDPKAGWKGKGAHPKVYKSQMRPDPLAH